MYSMRPKEDERKMAKTSYLLFVVKYFLIFFLIIRSVAKKKQFIFNQNDECLASVFP